MVALGPLVKLLLQAKMSRSAEPREPDQRWLIDRLRRFQQAMKACPRIVGIPCFRQHRALNLQSYRLPRHASLHRIDEPAQRFDVDRAIGPAGKEDARCNNCNGRIAYHLVAPGAAEAFFGGGQRSATPS